MIRQHSHDRNVWEHRACLKYETVRMKHKSICNKCVKWARVYYLADLYTTSLCLNVWLAKKKDLFTLSRLCEGQSGQRGLTNEPWLHVNDGKLQLRCGVTSNISEERERNRTPPSLQSIVMTTFRFYSLPREVRMGGKEIEGVLTRRHVVLTFAVLERLVGGGGDDKEQWGENGKKTERGQGRTTKKEEVKGWVREGQQRQKWVLGVRRFFLCPSSSHSPVTVTGLVIGRGPVSLSVSWLCSSAGASGPRNSWWQDRGCLSIYSRLPALPWQLRGGVVFRRMFAENCVFSLQGVKLTFLCLVFLQAAKRSFTVAEVFRQLPLYTPSTIWKKKSACLQLT